MSKQIPDNAKPFFIGRVATSYQDGMFDEFRISNTMRSTSWINMSYLIVANQSSYVGLGDEEARPGTWVNTELDRCKNITITNPTAETLTNFPAYINLTYDNDMQPDFLDIRFYSAGCNNGGTELDYEIENYTTSTNAHTWTRIPSLPSTGTTISVYYKNNTAVTSGANPAGVWDQYYTGVWHMQRANATDSTSNQNNATGIDANNSNSDGNTPPQQNASSKIDGGNAFDGVDDYIEAANSPSLNISGSSVTISAWVKYHDTGTHDIIVGKVFNSTAHQSPYFDYSLHILNYSGANDLPRMYVTTTSGIDSEPSTVAITPDQWSYVVGTYDGANIKIYLDGVQTGSEPHTGTLNTSDTPLRIG